MCLTDSFDVCEAFDDTTAIEEESFDEEERKRVPKRKKLHDFVSDFSEYESDSEGKKFKGN